MDASDGSRIFFAHSLREASKGEWQPLREHLHEVGRLAGARGEKFGAAYAAALAGLLHDLGKYTSGFQKRLEGGAKVDHATAGAKELRQLVDVKNKIIAEIIAYAIAGHHAGLPNSEGGMSSFNSRLNSQEIQPVDPIWRQEIGQIVDANARNLMPSPFNWSRETGAFALQLAFFGRMIFSCLVDADYRDTERFYHEVEGKAIDRDWPSLPENIDHLIARFDNYMRTLVRSEDKDTSVNQLRSEILTHVKARADAKPGLFTLNVPTGGGKTLASLAFALEHAKRYKLERIIYVIPFTSVIDQTATIFRDVLGEHFVLEHHSAIEEETIKDENSAHVREAAEKLKRAMEDWAAPVIVTTNVQFFESLYSNRPSRCRKLHNLVRSVIILDEAQTIPLHVLRPCLSALDELARNYGASIVLCTATQPAVGLSDDFKHGLPLELDRELAPNPQRLHEKLRRVRLVHIGEKSDDDLVEELKSTQQGLIIVNSRAHALDLYKKARNANLDGLIHLTTRQYAGHRRKILSDVRARLKAEAPCRLIATSLVEAGVDLNFPRVWRAEAGLDQIAQAVGRCNREGKRPIEDSIVSIFLPAKHKPPKEIKNLIGDMNRMKNNFANLLSPEAIREYFREVYWREDKQLDYYKILDKWTVVLANGALSFDYKTVGETFRLIESGMTPVIIARDAEAQNILADLTNGLSPNAAARRLQPYIVQIPPKAREKLIANGHVKAVDATGQFYQLVHEGLYSEEVGLAWGAAD